MRFGLAWVKDTVGSGGQLLLLQQTHVIVLNGLVRTLQKSRLANTKDYTHDPNSPDTSHERLEPRTSITSCILLIA